MHRINLKRVVFFSLIAVSSLVAFSFIKEASDAVSAEEVINKMLLSINHVKTLRYRLKIEERVNGKLEHRESKVKLQVSPRKLYLKIKNQEVLWIQGVNNDNAFVNPGTFPYVNLNLDPLGSLMRKGQHHTINELGFFYIQSIIRNYKELFKDDFKKHFFITGEEIFEGRSCYKLSVLVSEFSWHPYTVLKGENIVSIARKKYLSEYMILEGNPTISWYDDVKEGQVIQIPSSYAKYAILLIDKELMLPVYNKMIDDKGVYELYQYYDLKVNTPFAADEFSKDYKEYNF